MISNPTVGWVAQHFSMMYQRARGMYFSAIDKGQMASMVYNWPHQDVRLVVLTDGSSVGGDLGIGGMAIAQAKIDVYVASGAYFPK